LLAELLDLNRKLGSEALSLAHLWCKIVDGLRELLKDDCLLFNELVRALSELFLGQRAEILRREG